MMSGIWLSIFVATIALGCCNGVHGHKRSSPLNVETETWYYVPVIVIAVFSFFLVMGKKFQRLGNNSLRLFLVHFVSIETLYKTLGGATAHEYHEQWRIEVGHQVFTVGGIAFLSVSFIVNDVNGNEQRYLFYVLQLIQMGIMLLGVIFDSVMIYKGHLRSVRSMNTKLRFAQCTYQVFLFCTDVLSSGISALPPDCYIWATIHYSYEAVGLLLEGLNVIGMSEWAIIILLNSKAMTNEIDASGPLCAFGVTCMLGSCLSIVGGMIWKSLDAARLGPFNATEMEDATVGESESHGLIEHNHHRHH